MLDLCPTTKFLFFKPLSGELILFMKFILVLPAFRPKALVGSNSVIIVYCVSFDSAKGFMTGSSLASEKAKLEL